MLIFVLNHVKCKRFQKHFGILLLYNKKRTKKHYFLFVYNDLFLHNIKMYNTPLNSNIKKNKFIKTVYISKYQCKIDQIY